MSNHKGELLYSKFFGGAESKEIPKENVSLVLENREKMSPTVYFEIIPDKVKSAKQLVAKAAEYSKNFKIDMEIKKYFGSVAVDVYLRDGFSFSDSCKEKLLELIELSDDIEFTKTYDGRFAAKLSCLIDTHDLYINDEKV